MVKSVFKAWICLAISVSGAQDRTAPMQPRSTRKEEDREGVITICPRLGSAASLERIFHNRANESLHHVRSNQSIKTLHTFSTEAIPSELRALLSRRRSHPKFN